MTQGEKAQSIYGNKVYQIRARKAIPILVRQAIAQQPIYYTALAQELDMPNPRNLNYVLGSIGVTIQELSTKWHYEIPPLTCIVINKHTHLPGDGVSFFINDFSDFRNLPAKQKRDIVHLEFQKIYCFTRWIEVLNNLGLEYEQKFDYSDLMKSVIGGKSGVGESEFHYEFKKYISQNPQILGLPKSVGVGEMEKVLPSADIVDILFKTENEWIVAEVKSKIADIPDIYRGLYQCVKYQAIIEAYQTELGLQPNCRVALVLEGEFPNKLIVLRNLLGIDVIDDVSY